MGQYCCGYFGLDITRIILKDSFQDRNCEIEMLIVNVDLL